VVIFTKFDAQVVQEYVRLPNDVEPENYNAKWEKARQNAENIFQEVYLPKVLNSENPPRAYIYLEVNRRYVHMFHSTSLYSEIS